jgi:cytochrome c5
MNFRFAIALVFVSASVAGLAVSAQNPPAQSKPASSKVAASKSARNESAEGEKRFETHCGRCHNPPEDLSPREAKAVVRQMRVRAHLSAEDERLILKYLVP